MSESEILLELQPIFQSVLSNPSLVVSTETTAHDVDDWDSLNHATLIAKIQRHFKVKFSLFEVLKLKKVGDIIQLIQSSQA